MIPVLGVPILNRPDYLYSMLQSVDVPVRRLVVIDNGGVIDREAVRQAAHGITDHLVTISPGHNLGVAASWNLIIKVTPKVPWWFIVNNDIEFAAGDLQRLVDYMESDQSSLVQMLGASAFAIPSHVLRTVGWFDENFVPAYYEDNDYSRRCHLAGIRHVVVPSSAKHYGSATIGSDNNYQLENHRTFPHNGEYYRSKWGGYPGQETFETPFNRPLGPQEWTLSPQRLSDLSW